jgi:acyl carrier protein
MDAALAELAQAIIDGLNLEDLTPADLDPAAPLFGEGLGLDSIDALELAVVVNRRYGVKIADDPTGRAAFTSLNHLRRYIDQHRAR